MLYELYTYIKRKSITGTLMFTIFREILTLSNHSSKLELQKNTTIFNYFYIKFVILIEFYIQCFSHSIQLFIQNYELQLYSD